MKKIAIRVAYEDKTYISDYNEVSDDENKRLQDLCEYIARGKITYLNITSANVEYYFTKEILNKSIISLISKE